MHRLPTTAFLLGLAGLIPFIGCGLLAVAGDDPDRARRATAALTTYGAVILAFLGGVHWGFVLTPADASPRAASARLVVGVIPSLIGWMAATLPFILPADSGPALLAVGFAATVAGEAALRRRGLVPAGYMAMRWTLSAIVILTLVAVLASHLLGLTIAL